MSITRDKARGQFVFDFNRTIGGRTVRAQKRLPKAWSRAQADAFDRQESGRLYALATGVERQRATIEDAVALYLTDKHANKTITATAKELALIFWTYAGRFIDDLPEVARIITKHGTEVGWKPATIRNRIAYLRSACRWAWKQHAVCEHDPGGRIQMPKVKNEKSNFLTRLEAVTIARSMRSRTPVQRATRAALLVAFYSGMRVGEIIRAVAVEGMWVVRNTKNDDDAYVPILPKVAVYSRRWPRKVAKGTVQRYARDVLRAAGRGDATFHTLRHSTATAILAAGESLDMVGDILRHRDRRSTQRYAHRQREQMAAAMMKLQKSPTTGSDGPAKKAA